MNAPDYSPLSYRINERELPRLRTLRSDPAAKTEIAALDAYIASRAAAKPFADKIGPTSCLPAFRTAHNRP